MFLKIFAILFVLSFFGNAEEIQITADRDNTIYSEDGSKSNGAGQYIFSGRTNGGNLRRALVHFDISGSIPQGAMIETVTLTLSMSKGQEGAETVSIYAISSNWGEGESNAAANEGGGTDATTNDATWSHAFFDSQTWTTAGGDFNATADADLSVGAVGTYDWDSNAELVSTVQNWLDNPETNFGWLVKGNETDNKSTKRFDSREGSGKPTLTVTYSIATAIEESIGNQVEKFSLSDNYPNPFNPTTKIDISVPSVNNQNFALEVFNITGQLVKTLYAGTLSSGIYTFEWDGNNITGNKAASGVYFYTLHNQNIQIMKKMILLK